MKNRLALLCMVAALLGVIWPARMAALVADAQGIHASVMLATLSGNVYAPNGTGMVTSSGVTGNQLSLQIQLQHMPSPETMGGTAYKVWLVDPDSATAISGGVLTYHDDGTVEGIVATSYRYFTVIAVTAEKNLAGATPESPTILQGSVNMAAMDAALAATAPRVDVNAASPSATNISRDRNHGHIIVAGQAVLASRLLRAPV